MIYRQSYTYSKGFTVTNSSGALANADSLPTAVLKRNGLTDGAVTVTITNNGTGDYKADFVVPEAYVADDEIELLISATVGGVANKQYMGHGAVQPGVTLASAVQTVLDTIATRLTALWTRYR